MKTKPGAVGTKRTPRGKKRLQGLLENLSTAELILPTSRVDYLFRHALVQDAAYQSLLKNERKRLHNAIGLALEEATTGLGEDRAGELKHHFAEAGDDAKTIVYAVRAGDGATRIFAYPEASLHYQDALDALQRLFPSPDNLRLRVDVIVKWVAVSLRIKGPEACLLKLNQAEALLADLGTDEQDRERQARVHFWMGDAYSHLNRQQEAIGYLVRVLEAAREGVQDQNLLAIPSNVIGRALAAQGKFSQAEPLLAQAAPLLEESANWYEWILAVGFLGFARAAQGDTEGGLRETSRAFRRAQDLGTPVGLGDSYIFTSFIHHQRGEFEIVLEHATKALGLGKEISDQLLLYMAHNVTMTALTHLKRYEEAEQHFAEGLGIAAQMGGQVFYADMFQANYADLKLRQGDVPGAIANAEQAIVLAELTGSLFSQGLARRVLGMATGSSNELSESARYLDEGNARIEAALAREAWGDLERNKGNALQARALYETALNEFSRFGIDRSTARVQDKLGNLPND
jgi:tetratricopeptide (TPR) repeat protein